MEQDQVESNTADTDDDTLSDVDPVEAWEAEKEQLMQGPLGDASDTDAPEADQPTESKDETDPEPEVTPEADQPENELTQDAPREDEQEEEGERHKQYRLRPSNEIEEKAFQIKKVTPSLSLDEALSLARREIEGEPAKSGDQTTDENDSDSPAANMSTAQIRDRIRELRKSSVEAMRGLDMETAADHQAELMELEQAFDAALDYESRISSDVDASYDRVIEQYPEMADPESPAAQRAGEIYALWNEIGDPRLNDASYPETIAALVARESSLMQPQSPQSQPPRPAQAKPLSQAAATPRNRHQAVASPQSASTGQSVTATSTAKLLASVDTPEEWERLKEKLAS